MIYFDGIIYSWQKGGGVHRYFQKLISFTASQGVNSTLILQRPHYDALPQKNSHLHFDIVGPSILSRIPRNAFALARKLASPLNRFLMEHYFKNVMDGVFHSTYYTTYDNLRIPQVLTVHDMTYEKFPELYGDAGSKRLIKRKKLCIERADAIVCVSKATKKALLEMYQVPEEKISVIHHGVDDFFNTEYDKEIAKQLRARGAITKPFLLFVGNRAKYKNFDFLVRSFASWEKRDSFQMAVVGGGDFTPAEQTLLSGLGIAPQIRHLGHVNEEELKVLYCTCAAFVFPSLDEGFGLPILEAICCGAHVIASNIAVFKEIGLDIPYLFDPKNEESLVKAFEDLNKKPVSSIEQKKHNEKIIKSMFSWDKSLEKTIMLYKKIQKS